MGKGGGIRSEVVVAASRIKSRGLRTAIVTNNVKEFRDRWVESVPIDSICHEIVDSSEIGIRKPDPRIFEHALVQLGGIHPERTIFIDDFPGNVRAADAVGMRGVLMTDDYHEALRRVEALLA
jgi:epoxide hydrolase-like predicted phosphatase